VEDLFGKRTLNRKNLALKEGADPKESRVEARGREPWSAEVEKQPVKGKEEGSNLKSRAVTWKRQERRKAVGRGLGEGRELSAIQDILAQGQRRSFIIRKVGQTGGRK